MRHSLFFDRRSSRTFKATLLLAAALPLFSLGAQEPAKEPVKEPSPDVPPKKVTTFFATEEPLQITLWTNIGRLRGDKGENAPWRDAKLFLTGAESNPPIPLQLRTRGIWRLKNCQFPPLRMNFSRMTSKGSVFLGLDKPKLVSFCRDDSDSEQYVLQEFQLYRIYNLLTDYSHRVRLLDATYANDAGKVEAKRVAFILEEPEALAKRHGLKLLKLKGAGPGDIEPFHNALMGVFQYFIGNTDWSIYALHNAELLTQPDGLVLPIPFDFDFAGAVNTRYATADPKLSISRVRDRLFRGYCGPPEEFPKVFALFNEKKDAIYALYRDPIGKRLREEVVSSTLKYFDDFYRTINDPRAANREIIKACVSGR